MTQVWITIGVLAVTTALTRASGPVLLGGRDLPRALQGAIALLAPALLAALVVVQTIGPPAGGEIVVDERLIGVGAAAIVLLRGGSMLPAVAVAALATALARLVA